MELLGEGQSGYSNFFCTSKIGGGGGALKNTLYKNMSFARAGLDGDGMTGLVMTGMAPGMPGVFMPGVIMTGVGGTRVWQKNKKYSI